jgi:hypothetical protein
VMTKQLGNTGRGTKQLDEARRNKGVGGERDGQDRPGGPLASGDEEAWKAAESDDEEAADEGHWGSEGHDHTHGDDEEALDNEEGGQYAQPGGSAPSESERPDDPSSRWGDGNERPKR